MKAPRHIDIQTKIILLLVAVIVPTFFFVTVLQNKVTQPILEQEMRQSGVASAQSLELKILTNHWLSRKELYPEIQSEIQEQAYSQPSILRIDVYARDPATDVWKTIASTVEGETDAVVSPPAIANVTSAFTTEDGMPTWDIVVPVRRTGTTGTLAHPHKMLGAVHVVVSTRSVQRVLDTFWKVSVSAAVLTTIILILMLSYFLRRAVWNERLLRQAESQNVQLSEQLQEAQRELMNIEKLAVMGQLTANFAHEIGTPLNAIGGHLQLLSGEVQSRDLLPRSKERLEIIRGELLRIENIVKSFLQTTAKPKSQKQLVDLNVVIEKSISIVRPRLDRLSVELKFEEDRTLGPLRLVPTDVEQILLNLLNNSLDSLQSKRTRNPKSRLQMNLATSRLRRESKEWAQISVHDTGEGIPKADLGKVTKPFFTTKRPGEGTGLGLTICRELAAKYGGELEIESKEGAWTEVRLRFPYGVNA